MSQSGLIRRVVRFVVLGGMVVAVGAGFGRYAGVVEARQQNTGAPYIPPVYQPGSPGDLLDEAHRARTENHDRVKGLNDERHKKLEDDAAKLLAREKSYGTLEIRPVAVFNPLGDPSTGAGDGTRSTDDGVGRTGGGGGDRSGRDGGAGRTTK